MLPSLLAALSLTAGTTAQVPDISAANADVIVTGPSGGSGFGRALAAIGDLNSDGFDDFLVGSLSTPTGIGAGRVWVIFGPLGNFDSNFIFDGENAGDGFGTSIDSRGDFDGDGVFDFIIGAPGFDGAGTNRGKTYVISGDDGSMLASWVGAVDNWEMGARVRFFANVDDEPGDELLNLARVSTNNEFTEVQSAVGGFLFAVDGRQFAPAGRVNMDMIPDIVAGFPSDTTNGAGAGRIFFYNGVTGADISDSDDGPFGNVDEHLGREVAFLGDVNGDGFSDILASGFEYDDARGRVRIISGEEDNFITLHQLEGEAEGDQFGISLAGAGDITGDGVPDALIGAHLNETEGEGVGRVYLYCGATGDLVRTYTGEGEDDFEYFGHRVTSADVNGDGVQDVIVSAFAAGQGRAGRVYVFFSPRPCPADFDGDGDVDGADMAHLLANWGACPAPTVRPCIEDLDVDNDVNGADLAALLANWGSCEPEELLGGGSGEGFLLGLFENEFEDLEDYFSWLGGLTEQQLMAHLSELIEAILESSE